MTDLYNCLACEMVTGESNRGQQSLNGMRERLIPFMYEQSNPSHFLSLQLTKLSTSVEGLDPGTTAVGIRRGAIDLVLHFRICAFETATSKRARPAPTGYLQATARSIRDQRISNDYLLTGYIISIFLPSYCSCPYTKTLRRIILNYCFSRMIKLKVCELATTADTHCISEWTA